MRKSVYVAFVLVLGSLLLGACNEKNDDGTPVPDHTAILSIRIGNTGAEASSVSTASRAPMTRAGLEDDIQTVDVLSFKSDPLDPTNMLKGTFFYRARGTYQVQGGIGYVRVQLVGNTERQTLVVLVNARKQVDALGATYGEQRIQVMKRMKLRVDAVSGKVVMNVAEGMPMWGELPAQTVNESYAQTPASAPAVTLERMVAKVSINVGTETVSECNYYHGYTSGLIAPNNTTNTPTLDATDAFTPPFYVRYKTDFPATGGTSFYLFESDNIAKTTNLLTNNFITIKVTNNHATPYWYRIDMKDYNTVNGFYDILRNRHYKVDLTEGTTIDTPGADTEEEAIKGRFKLKCKIVPWYDVNEEVIVDPVKRINVDSRSIYISKSEALTGKTITIKTENTSGWTITDVPSWLNVSQTSNTSDGTTTVTVSSNVVATGIKVGNFTIKARNAQYLEMPISVRIGKLPLEYVAEYNLAGGIQYGSIPRDVTPTGAQTEAALRWATNHNNDQSGYYNWYVCKGVYDATYNPNTKNLFNDVFFTTGAGKDYHLPSQAEWTGATSYAHARYHYYSSSPNINEAIEFGDTKGTYASDYYHSDHLVPGFPSDTRVGYALRYKKATGNPLGGFSTIDFPQATDNSLACAFRYERLHLLNYSNDIPANVKVQCVYVGDQDPLPDLYTVIARESWWNAQPADKVITRIFEVPGYFRQAKPSEVGPFNDTYTSRGRNGYFWSSEEKDTSTSFAMWVINSGIVSYSANDKHMGSSVRLFSNE